MSSEIQNITDKGNDGKLYQSFLSFGPGTASWRTIQLPGLRLRVVEYSPGYVADHWCLKGHIVHCLDGEFVSEMEDGGAFTLKKGMTYVVSDELSLHRSVSGPGATLLIIDGDFLRR